VLLILSGTIQSLPPGNLKYKYNDKFRLSVQGPVLKGEVLMLKDA